jgi:Ni,Fe-hydrogenase I large subunit
MEKERQAREAADARICPTKADIKAEQYFINFRYGPDLPIFGKILDHKTLGYDVQEQKFINESYEQPHMKYYRPSKAYSSACEWGEVGDINLSEISAIIDAELFNWYKDNRWAKPLER